MPNIYEMLIGAPPSGPDQTAATADALRRRTLTGQLGMISGDPALSQVGQGMVTGAQEEVKQLQDARQKGAQRDMMQGYYDAQQRNWEAQRGLAERKETRQAADSVAQRELMGDHYKAMRQNWENQHWQQVDELGFKYDKLEQEKALGLAELESKGGDFKKLGFAERRNALDAVSTGAEMQEAVNTFKDDYAGTGLPYTGSLANWMSANAPAFTTKDMEEKQMWWARWDRAYNLPERNAMFGATLTNAEKSAWAAANVNPNMEAEQIKNNLAVIMEIRANVLGRMQKALIDDGRNPSVINGMFGETIESIRRGTPQKDSAPAQAQAAAAGTGPARPETQEDYDALPSGAQFVDPDDGKLYTKP